MKQKLLTLVESKESLETILLSNKLRWFNIVFLEQGREQGFNRYFIFRGVPVLEPLQTLREWIDEHIDDDLNVYNEDNMEEIDYIALIEEDSFKPRT